MGIAKNSFCSCKKRRLAAVFVSFYVTGKSEGEKSEGEKSEGEKEKKEKRCGGLLFCVKSDIWKSYLSLFTSGDASKGAVAPKGGEG